MPIEILLDNFHVKHCASRGSGCLLCVPSITLLKLVFVVQLVLLIYKVIRKIIVDEFDRKSRVNPPHTVSPIGPK